MLESQSCTKQTTGGHFLLRTCLSVLRLLFGQPVFADTILKSKLVMEDLSMELG